MLGGIDFGCLVDRAMVQPQDDVVVIIEARTGDGYGFIGVVREDG